MCHKCKDCGASFEARRTDEIICPACVKANRKRLANEWNRINRKKSAKEMTKSEFVPKKETKTRCSWEAGVAEPVLRTVNRGRVPGGGGAFSVKIQAGRDYLMAHSIYS